jgi:hypothetical protein
MTAIVIVFSIYFLPSSSEVMQQACATELATFNSNANWALVVRTLDFASLMTKLIMPIFLVWAVVLEKIFTLKFNRPDLLCKAVTLFINDSSGLLFWSRSRSAIFTGRESHFLCVTVLAQYDGVVSSTAILWIIVQSDRTWRFRPLWESNPRNFWVFCPVQFFWNKLTHFTTLGVICVQLAVVASNIYIRTIWLAEIEMSVFVATIPTDICDIEFFELFTWQL